MFLTPKLGLPLPTTQEWETSHTFSPHSIPLTMPINYFGYRSLPPKTRERAFQVLKRTVWSNNKAFKSRTRLDPYCEQCGYNGTVEHLLCVCMNFSQLLGIHQEEIITLQCIPEPKCSGSHNKSRALAAQCYLQSFPTPRSYYTFKTS